MGLGKTVQALAQMLVHGGQGPSLVVAPTSVCLNWESEAVKFAPTLNVMHVRRREPREKCLKELKPFDLVICSYGLLQQEGELLATVNWQAIVLDEAQAIKNMATKRSQAAMELNGAFKMVATGTPDREPPGRALERVPFHQPGAARLAQAVQREVRLPHREGSGQEGARPAEKADPALHPAPHQEPGAGGAPLAHRDRASRSR